MTRAVLVRAASGTLAIAMSGCLVLARTPQPPNAAPKTRTNSGKHTTHHTGTLGSASGALSYPAHTSAPGTSKNHDPSMPNTVTTPSSRARTARVFHRVSEGQTLYRIALSYGVSVPEICRVNGIADSAQIKAGLVLVIPQGNVASAVREASAARRKQRETPRMRGRSDLLAQGASKPRSGAAAPRTSFAAGTPSGTAVAGPPLQVRTLSSSRLDSEGWRRTVSGAAAAALASSDALRTPYPGTSTCPAEPISSTVDASEPPEAQEAEDEDLVGPDETAVGVSYTLIPSDEPFSWPVQGGIVRSPFGIRHGRLHAGLDISAPEGSPVYPAREGSVLYSGHKFRGYGNVVMLDHGDGFVTLYAHNEKNLVRQGEHVARGQVIARVGATGNATGSHCHFEIRRGEIAIDPGQYLPAASASETFLARNGVSSRSARSPIGINEAGMMSPLP